MLKTSSAANTQLQRLMVVDDEAVKGGDILNKKSLKSKYLVFLTADARQAFTQLRQAFTKAPILSHFDLERHIKIETDASGYAISDIPS